MKARVRPELVQSLRALDPAYADWVVGISYEVEQKTGDLRPHPVRRSAPATPPNDAIDAVIILAIVLSSGLLGSGKKGRRRARWSACSGS